MQGKFLCGRNILRDSEGQGGGNILIENSPHKFPHKSVWKYGGCGCLARWEWLDHNSAMTFNKSSSLLLVKSYIKPPYLLLVNLLLELDWLSAHSVYAGGMCVWQFGNKIFLLVQQCLPASSNISFGIQTWLQGGSKLSWHRQSSYWIIATVSKINKNVLICYHDIAIFVMLS